MVPSLSSVSSILWGLLQQLEAYGYITWNDIENVTHKIYALNN
jgi:hypothetical protein